MELNKTAHTSGRNGLRCGADARGAISVEKETFRPYIPADRIMPELTGTSIVLGVLLAVLFGAANAYLGLRVGMTVSASIRTT